MWTHTDSTLGRKRDERNRQCRIRNNQWRVQKGDNPLRWLRSRNFGNWSAKSFSAPFKNPSPLSLSLSLWLGCSVSPFLYTPPLTPIFLDSCLPTGPDPATALRLRVTFRISSLPPSVGYDGLVISQYLCNIFSPPCVSFQIISGNNAISRCVTRPFFFVQQQIWK